ncbi:MAG: hypothetical protein DRR16_07365 [Candidatus Parabeggiatoa sp. nov. 3]|nr:MAG: hypothetical protein DRQ99_19405 [Gammaproteobacteria bacterium]RKZ87398.1 MAG: hypothetical protein DRR16_07365 [Gammaproteobacteria bacterium]
MKYPNLDCQLYFSRKSFCVKNNLEHHLQATEHEARWQVDWQLGSFKPLLDDFSQEINKLHNHQDTEFTEFKQNLRINRIKTKATNSITPTNPFCKFYHSVNSIIL